MLPIAVSARTSRGQAADKPDGRLGVCRDVGRQSKTNRQTSFDALFAKAYFVQVLDEPRWTSHRKGMHVFGRTARLFPLSRTIDVSFVTNLYCLAIRRGRPGRTSACAAASIRMPA